MHKSNELHQKFIELKNIVVSSNGSVILDIPDARIPADRISACIGPNGAGKTTLLKLLAGLITPDSGSITYSFTPAKTALVLHHTPMLKATTRANLSMVKDSDPNITNEQIDAILEKINLSNFADRPAHKLSAGERQKLCLGRAVLLEPNLMLLDEPTANLDPNTTEQVEEMIRQFFNQGIEVIFSSHQLAQVKRIAEHIIFIDHGQIKEMGPVDPFFLNPQTSAAKRYLHQELLTD